MLRFFRINTYIVRCFNWQQIFDIFGKIGELSFNGWHKRLDIVCIILSLKANQSAVVSYHIFEWIYDEIWRYITFHKSHSCL